jgi:hypothetical protein
MRGPLVHIGGCGSMRHCFKYYLLPGLVWGVLIAEMTTTGQLDDLHHEHSFTVGQTRTGLAAALRNAGSQDKTYASGMEQSLAQENLSSKIF